MQTGSNLVEGLVRTHLVVHASMHPYTSCTTHACMSPCMHTRPLYIQQTLYGCTCNVVSTMNIMTVLYQYRIASACTARLMFLVFQTLPAIGLLLVPYLDWVINIHSSLIPRPRVWPVHNWRADPHWPICLHIHLTWPVNAKAIILNSGA